MITGELKSKVDRIWDTVWSGCVSNPLSVIEQLTCLLTLRESKAARTGKPIEEPVFGPKHTLESLPSDIEGFYDARFQDDGWGLDVDIDWDSPRREF